MQQLSSARSPQDEGAIEILIGWESGAKKHSEREKDERSGRDLKGARVCFLCRSVPPSQGSLLLQQQLKVKENLGFQLSPFSLQWPPSTTVEGEGRDDWLVTQQ